ncbi:MAG: 50S ribosomal protein L11 methyltransferase [Burkholderiales bacterium]|nr:50S ribosomal protein L11 methyltransferase [Burkholderiales bacterium]
MIEVVLIAPEPLVERLSDALIDELEALSVSVEDAEAGTAQERALFGEPGMPAHGGAWQRSTLKALFDDEARAAAACALLLAPVWAGEVRMVSFADVPERDWVQLTQAQFAPVEVSAGFWIVPSWHEPPAQADRLIRLDPGMAFGTGTHPTTRMCLRWIARQAPSLARQWDRVLDYGCGSGILAIGAALHGARRIDAVDIDPAAVQATRSNAAANGVTLSTGLPDMAAGRYALVLANILASPLKLLAPLLCERVAPGGNLLLAGILERQADELRQAYAPWVALEVADRDEGWVLMHATSPR